MHVLNEAGHEAARTVRHKVASDEPWSRLIFPGSCRNRGAVAGCRLGIYEPLFRVDALAIRFKLLRVHERVLDPLGLLRSLRELGRDLQHHYGILPPFHLHEDVGDIHAITDITGLETDGGQAHDVSFVEFSMAAPQEHCQAVKLGAKDGFS